MGVRLGVCGGADVSGVSGLGPSGCACAAQLGVLAVGSPAGWAELVAASRFAAVPRGSARGGIGVVSAVGGFCGGSHRARLRRDPFCVLLRSLRACCCLAMAFWPEEVMASRLSPRGVVMGVDQPAEQDGWETSCFVACSARGRSCAVYQAIPEGLVAPVFSVCSPPCAWLLKEGVALVQVWGQGRLPGTPWGLPPP